MGAQPKEMLRVVADTRLSSDARIVVLHLASLGEGEHELDYRELRRLLNQAGEKRVRNAVQDAIGVGWIHWRAGGRGHSAFASFTPPAEEVVKDGPGKNTTAQDAVVSDRTAQDAVVSTDRTAQDAVVTAAPSSIHPTSTSTSGRAQVRGSASPEDLEALEAILGDHAAAAGLMDRSARHSPSWAAAVVGAYGPDGTRDRVWSGVPPNERAAALATALQDYATSGKPFSNRLFEGYVKDEVKQRKRGDDDESGGSDRAGTGQKDGRATGRGGGAEDYAHLEA